MDTLDGIGLEHQYITVNGVQLHVVQAGPQEGSPVILLHGFPEFWYGWRKQIPHLARAGFRVWVPDGRGYNLSDKPAGIKAYAEDELVEDVLGLIRATGHEVAHVVGHDWGGIVAWRLAERHPTWVSRLVILNVPHPYVLKQTLRNSGQQRLKSSYVAFFQLPMLPEVSLRARNYRWLARALQGSSHAGAFTADDLSLYRRAWSCPGALTGMLNWYRAALRFPVPYEDMPRIQVPTLLLWGVQDAFLGQEMAQPSIALCDDGRLEWFPEATHWVQHEEPEEVNRFIQAFLKGAD